jgi:hypothetical protein
LSSALVKPIAETQPATRALHWIIAAPIRDSTAAAISLSIGAALCLYVFGLDFVLGRGDYWSYPSGDAAMQLGGFRYFVHDSWHFPLLRTTFIDPPTGLNVLFVDAIPLVALPCKLLAPIIGTNFNPFGLWMLACYALQAYFASRLVRTLGHRALFATLIACGFALTCHAFLGRFVHQDLNAQFLLLWAFTVYFARPMERGFRAWAAVLTAALLVHPYLFAMTIAVFVAAFFRRAPEGELRRWRKRAGVALGVVGLLTTIGFLTGHFSGQVAHGKCGDFGLASHNVASLVVPLVGRSALFPGAPPLDGTGMQWEGSMFLGFGVLVLLVVHLFASMRLIGRYLRAHLALAIVLGALYAYSPANRVFLFRSALFSYDLPAPIAWFAHQFRATGRFAWPAGFFVILVVVPLTLRRFRAQVAVPLLLVCCALEIYDARTYIGVVHAETRHSWDRRLDWPAYQAAIAAHERVDQSPTQPCLGHWQEEAIGGTSREIQFMAASVPRTINGVFAGRNTHHCGAERRELPPFRHRPGALTLFPRLSAPTTRPPECRPVGFWIVCSDRWQLASMAPLAALADHDAAPSYRAGQALDFNFSRSVTPYLDGGWIPAHRESPWVGRSEPAGQRFALANLEGRDYRLKADLNAWEPATLDVEINGVRLATWQLSGNEHRELNIPRLLIPDGVIEIRWTLTSGAGIRFSVLSIE